MDDLDFDIGDWLGSIESGLDLSGGDTSWLDTVDWGSMLENMDFSNLDLSNVYGDISAGGLGGLEDIVITGDGTTDLSGFDLETADSVYGGSDLGTGLTYYPGEGYGTGTAGGMGGAEGLIGDTTDIFGTDDGAGTIVITGEKEDKPSILTDGEHDRTIVDTEPECKPGSETVQKFRDGSTLTLDCKGNVIGSTPKTKEVDDPEEDEPCEPGTETTKTYENGATITFDCKGRVISSTGPTTTPDTKCPPNSNTTETLPDGTKVVKDCKGNVLSTTKPGDKTTPPGSDMTKWLALLGGILGLLGGKSGGGGGAGYQGGIPKYTATRGPSRSPTAGGRRPGGAGIGSLTGGVTYTPTGGMLTVGAAGGGLMDLAGGGRAARYLRGGTDGMADKIQTDIDGKQPARLSHGEFVIPADVVSHLGNGNSDAGADVLYDMMAKVRKARTGTPKQGKQINPRKYTPV